MLNNRLTPPSGNPGSATVMYYKMIIKIKYTCPLNGNSLGICFKTALAYIGISPPCGNKISSTVARTRFLNAKGAILQLHDGYFFDSEACAIYVMNNLNQNETNLCKM